MSTTSPLQALTLLNHGFTVRMAEALDKRLARMATREHIEQAFLLAYGRPAEPEEISESMRLIEKHGFVHFARALFNTNEFLYVY